MLFTARISRTETPNEKLNLIEKRKRTNAQNEKKL